VLLPRAYRDTRAERMPRTMPTSGVKRRCPGLIKKQPNASECNPAVLDHQALRPIVSIAGKGFGLESFEGRVGIQRH
jgi:hypothetical protein